MLLTIVHVQPHESRDGLTRLVRVRVRVRVMDRVRVRMRVRVRVRVRVRNPATP